MKLISKIIKIFVSLFIVIFLSNNVLALAEEYPTNYEEDIIRYMSRNLKVPDSAKYQFDKPFIAKIHDIDEYVIHVNVNAKNSYGTYTGFKEYYFTYDKRYFGENIRDITDWVDAGVILFE